MTLAKLEIGDNVRAGSRPRGTRRCVALSSASAVRRGLLTISTSNMWPFARSHSSSERTTPKQEDRNPFDMLGGAGAVSPQGQGSGSGTTPVGSLKASSPVGQQPLSPSARAFSFMGPAGHASSSSAGTISLPPTPGVTPGAGPPTSELLIPPLQSRGFPRLYNPSFPCPSPFSSPSSASSTLLLAGFSPALGLARWPHLLDYPIDVTVC